METRQRLPAPRRPRTWQGSLRAGCAGLLIFGLVLLAGGCGSPAEPVERKPPVPQPVADLTAAQSGNSVVLAFALPREAVDHRPLSPPLAIEIYRNFEPAAGTPPVNSAKPPSPTLQATIPAAVADNYTEQGRVRYSDPIQPEDFTQHPDSVAVYIVRTRASAKESGDSNTAAIHLHPAAEPIEDVKAEVTHSGIQIAWTPPQKTLVGSAPPIALYRVYRAESQPATAPVSPATTASANPSPTSGRAAPQVTPVTLKVGETENTTYLDTYFDLGKTYTYTVRSVVQYAADQVESADSDPFVVVARDVSPPAAPQGIIVVYVPAQDAVPALELSWGISPETDLAGYNVYRSEQGGLRGTRANTELLLTPAFRDMNAVPGHSYFYSVTAVDRSGNESPASASVSGSVPAEGQSTP